MPDLPAITVSVEMNPRDEKQLMYDGPIWEYNKLVLEKVGDILEEIVDMRQSGEVGKIGFEGDELVWKSNDGNRQVIATTPSYVVTFARIDPFESDVWGLYDREEALEKAEEVEEYLDEHSADYSEPSVRSRREVVQEDMDEEGVVVASGGDHISELKVKAVETQG